MKKVIPFFLLLSSTLFSKVKVVSCNLENFGQTKSALSMSYIAITLKTYGIVAIQAVAKLTT
jgi:deoxyribonuclease-1-like protein